MCFLENSKLLVFNFQVSYKDTYNLVIGIWWAQMESNHRPHAYQACALTI